METQNGFHPGAALTGLVFVALGVLFLLDAVDVAEWRYDLLLPGALIALGVAAIAGAVLRGRES